MLPDPEALFAYCKMEAEKTEQVTHAIGTVVGRAGEIFRKGSDMKIIIGMGLGDNLVLCPPPSPTHTFGPREGKGHI